MFIILHDEEDGREIIINPKKVESVDGSRVYFQGYAYAVKESYEEIKEKLKKWYMQKLEGKNHD